MSFNVTNYNAATHLYILELAKKTSYGCDSSEWDRMVDPTNYNATTHKYILLKDLQIKRVTLNITRVIVGRSLHLIPEI